MMIDENDGILIEMYLDGALEGDALVNFETRLKNEPELNKALEERRELHQFLTQQEKREAFKANLPELTEQFFKKETPIRRLYQTNLFKIGLAAASVALVLFFWQPWKKPSLYEQFAQHDALTLVERGGGRIDPSQIEIVINDKHFQDAIPLLQSYLLEFPTSVNARLYLGIAYLETNDYTKAELIFESIAGGESILKHDGLWYMALSSLKQNKIKVAKGYLSLIPEESKRFAEAKRLLEQLSS